MKFFKALSGLSVFTGAILGVGHLDYCSQMSQDPDWIILAFALGFAFAGMALLSACEIVEREHDTRRKGIY